eukprot:1623669-Rhodomonas_salina.1
MATEAPLVSKNVLPEPATAHRVSLRPRHHQTRAPVPDIATHTAVRVTAGARRAHVSDESECVSEERGTRARLGSERVRRRNREASVSGDKGWERDLRGGWRR